MHTKKVVHKENIDTFKLKLQDYKVLIDADIETFSRHVVADTGEQFGELSAESMRVFCDVLSRGGKRIRGALTMLAYEMYGGKDQGVSVQAARIMEIFQTYLLITDDVYDRSRTRRGLPSAHIMHKERHELESWKDDSHHFGETIAINSGLVGCHMAMVMATELNVPNGYIVKALATLNRNLQVTAEGQANDVFNEVTESIDAQKIENVLVWKTAYYTFVNPLQFGAILAGASDKDLEELREYSIYAGRSFQITDDVLGMFGSEFESGKSPMDDTREGKRTLLTNYAFGKVDKEDAYFLSSMLGNQDLTQADFAHVKEIIFSSGAYEYALEEAKKSSIAASECANENWSKNHKLQRDFLVGLAEYLLIRKS